MFEIKTSPPMGKAGVLRYPTMRRVRQFPALVMILFAMAASGCAASGQARYVYQDGQFGVVGIPENTDYWPTHYQEKARELMAQHFPDGFEIVRAEEVVEGSRTLTLNGVNSAQVEAESVIPLIKLGKIGRTATRTQADNVKIKECRILYKRAGVEGEPIESGFAERSTLSPEPYIDPNAEARMHIVAKPKPVETLAASPPVVSASPQSAPAPE